MLLPAHRAYAFKCEIVDWRMKASPPSTSSNSGQGDQLGGQETDQSRLLPEYLFQKVCCLRDGIGDVVLTAMKIESVQGHIATDVIAEAALGPIMKPPKAQVRTDLRSMIIVVHLFDA